MLEKSTLKLEREREGENEREIYIERGICTCTYLGSCMGRASARGPGWNDILRACNVQARAGPGLVNNNVAGCGPGPQFQTFACMHVYIYVWTGACCIVCMCVCIHVCVYVCACMLAYVCMYHCMYTCMYVSSTST